MVYGYRVKVLSDEPTAADEEVGGTLTYDADPPAAEGRAERFS